MVLKQIQDLLFDHDCVIIPDFGGLIAQYASAKIHPVKHTFIPPSKKIAFNEKLKSNDGLLISSLARHLRIPNENAQQMVAQFVGNLQSDLAKEQRCELQGIGVFRYNAERKLEFEYLEADNYLGNSFGLPEFEVRPVIPAETAALRTLRQKTAPKQVLAGGNRLTRFSRKYATVAGTVLLGGLTVALVYLVSLQTDYNLSSLNPVTLVNNSNEKEIAADKTAVLSGQQPEAAPAAVAEEFPVTPEETSVKAVEEDYTANTLAKETQSPDANASAGIAVTENAPVKKEVSPENAKAEPSKSTLTKTSAPKVILPKPEVKTAGTAVTKTVAKAPEKVATAIVAKTPEKKLAPATKANTINGATGRYFVISGGYLSITNAERSKKDLTAKGADSDIILPAKGSKLHRVSVAEFETMEMATAKLPELRKKFGKSLWILNY
jgi:cell division protein FtsN